MVVISLSDANGIHWCSHISRVHIVQIMDSQNVVEYSSASQQHYPAVLDKHKSVIKTKQKSNEFYVSGQKAFVDCFKHHDLKEKFHPWK